MQKQQQQSQHELGKSAQQQYQLQSFDSVEQTMRNYDHQMVDNSRFEESSFLDNIAYQRSAFMAQDYHDIQDLNQKKETTICSEEPNEDISKLSMVTTTKRQDIIHDHTSLPISIISSANPDKNATSINLNKQNNPEISNGYFASNSGNNINSSSQLNIQSSNNFNCNTTHYSIYNNPASNTNTFLHSLKNNNNSNFQSSGFNSKSKIVSQAEENYLGQYDKSSQGQGRQYHINTNEEGGNVKAADALLQNNSNNIGVKETVQNAPVLQQRVRRQVSSTAPFSIQLKPLDFSPGEDQQIMHQFANIARKAQSTFTPDQQNGFSPTINNPMFIDSSKSKQDCSLSNSIKSKKIVKLKLKQRLQCFLHRFTQFGRLEMLTQQIRKQIRDSSDDYFEENHSHLKCNWADGQSIHSNHRILFRATQIFQKLSVLSPCSPGLLILQSCIGVMNISFAIYVNVVLAFQMHQSSVEISQFLLGAMKIIWLIQVLVQLNTGYVTSHGICFVRMNIIIRKFRSIGFIFGQCIPLLFLWIFSEYYHNPGIFSEDKNGIQGLIFIVIFTIPLGFKVLGELYSFHKLGFYLLKDYEFNIVYQISSLIVQSLLVVHALACAQYLILRKELNNESDINHLIWSMDRSQINTDWPGNYLQSIYWSVTISSTLSTLVPSSNLELVFSIFTIFLTLTLLVYFFSELQALFLEQRGKQKELRTDSQALNGFLNMKKVNLSASIRANMSLKEHHKKICHGLSEEKIILSKLSHSIREEILVSAHARVLEGCKFLQLLFSADSVHRIQARMEEIVLQNKQKLSEWRGANSAGEQYLYVVENGAVQIEERSAYLEKSQSFNEFGEILSCTENSSSKDDDDDQTEERYGSEESFSSYQSSYLNQNNQKQYILNKPRINLTHRLIPQGGYIGVYELFTGSGFVHGESKGITRLLRISRSSIINILKNNDRDYQVFMEISSRISLQNEAPLNILGINCSICNSKIQKTKQNNKKPSNHLQQNCYLLHFDKKSPYTVLKHIHTQIQHRQYYPRTSKRQLTTWSHYMAINQSQMTSTNNNILESMTDSKQDNFHQVFFPSIVTKDLMQEFSYNPKDSFIPRQSSSIQMKESLKPKESLKSIFKNENSFHPKDSYQFKESLVSRDSLQLKEPSILNTGSLQLIGPGQSKDLFFSRESGKQISIIPISKSPRNNNNNNQTDYDNTILSNKPKDDTVLSDKSRKLSGIPSSNLIEEDDQHGAFGSLGDGPHENSSSNITQFYSQKLIGAEKSPKKSGLNPRKSTSLLKVRTNELLSLLERPISLNAISSQSPISPSRSQMQLAKEFASRQSSVLKDSSSKQYSDSKSQESLSLPLFPALFKQQPSSNKNGYVRHNIAEEEQREQRWNHLSTLPNLDVIQDFSFYFRNGNHGLILQSFEFAQAKFFQNQAHKYFPIKQY